MSSPPEGEAGVPTPTNASQTDENAAAIPADATAQSAEPTPPLSTAESSPPMTTLAAVAATPAPQISPVPVTPIVPDENLTPDQLRAKKMFERWQRAFLGAVDKQPEEYILAMLREGEDLVVGGLLDLNRSIKPASGSTFLHTVAWFQKAKIMEWLLDHGANPNQGNLKGNTPLHLLCEQANKDIAPQLIQLMVDFGGDLELKDGGENPLSSIEKAKAVGFDVTKLDFTRRTEFLARRDGSVSGGPGSGEGEGQPQGMSEEERKVAMDKAKLVYRKLSTLFLGLEAEGVSQAVDDAIVRILTANLGLIHAKILDVNAPPLQAEGNLKTFLHYASIARRPEIVKVLLLALQPEQIDLQDESGDTALHHAILLLEQAGDAGASIVSQLLDAGASTTVANYLKGLTPPQMLPSNARLETKQWLKEQLNKPKPQRLEKNALASKLFGAGGSGLNTGSGGSSGPIAPLTPSSSGNAEKQDRAGARAMMARMASSLNAGMLSGGGAAGPTAATSQPSKALGLIQKATSNARSSARASGGAGGTAGFSAALQQIMASKGATPGVAQGGMGGVGQMTNAAQVAAAQAAKRPVNAKKLLSERALLLDQLFSQLDLSETNTITPVQLLAMHEEMHSCGSGSCTSSMVTQVLEQVVPAGQCTRVNLLEVLSGLEILCTETQQLRWDFRLMDFHGLGSLSTQDGTAGFAFAPAELVWTINQVDAGQVKYDDYLARQTKQQKNQRPKEVKWIEMQSELVGKLPSLG